MMTTIPPIARDSNQQMQGEQSIHMTLNHNIEQAFLSARSRLIRYARTQNVAPDAVEDIVQETLVEAWRHLDHLRSPDSFDSWLHGICHNVCKRWARATGESTIQISLSSPIETIIDVSDPLALDPVEELDRQDLTILLDRALSYLPDEARSLVELCYLAEMPQREVALQLGMTISALEARLHRARRQLRQVLTNELRADAEAFGLAMGEDTLYGWRESRAWCRKCGRHRLQGNFERLPDGNINFRMRCPSCSRSGFDMIYTGGRVPLGGSRSFRPAIKRSEQAFREFTTSYKDGWGICPLCCERRKAHLMPYAEYFSLFYPGATTPFDGYCMLLQCPSCDADFMTGAFAHALVHPTVQQFLQQHPRSILEPQIFTAYASQPAVRVCLADVTSATRLTIFGHRETLALLAVIQE